MANGSDGWTDFDGWRERANVADSPRICKRCVVGFIYPVPDFADIPRKYLLFAPEKVLYGTDASSYPSVPGGADVQHLMLLRATRSTWRWQDSFAMV